MTGPQPPAPDTTDARSRWMADTLQLHVPALTPPSLTPPSLTPPSLTPPSAGPASLPTMPRLQLRDPTAMRPPPPSFLSPPPAAPPPDPSQGPPSPTLSRDGIDVEAEAARPATGAPIQLFPSVRMAARTPYNGGPIGPDVRGPVTSAEVGATIVQVGNEALNAQIRASLEHSPDGLTPHATLHLERQVGPVTIEVEGDTTGQAHEATIGVGGKF